MREYSPEYNADLAKDRIAGYRQTNSNSKSEFCVFGLFLYLIIFNLANFHSLYSCPLIKITKYCKVRNLINYFITINLLYYYCLFIMIMISIFIIIIIILFCLINHWVLEERSLEFFQKKMMILKLCDSFLIVDSLLIVFLVRRWGRLGYAFREMWLMRGHNYNFQEVLENLNLCLIFNQYPFSLIYA